MFVVGKEYEFHLLEGEDEITMHGTIEKYEHPLIKCADIHFSKDSAFMPGKTVPGQIINVTSPQFIRAVMTVDQ